ncbi:MAG: 3'(2'),5'-bisphosphate nucleotidase CysQ [Pontibacterium sp.]
MNNQPTTQLHSLDLITLIQDLKNICYQASDAIMAIYNGHDIEAQQKADKSPITAADIAAHHIIAKQLKALTPDIPLLSEEGEHTPLAERLSWQRYWCIDPVDGTKEFIAKTGEFTVNIALVEQGQPLFGIICQPTNKALWWGGKSVGAWKQTFNQEATRIKTRSLSKQLTVIASRRHGKERNQHIMARVLDRFDQVFFEDCGSSLKMCRIAEGTADFYPRCFPTCEWDTAAAQAIIEGSGGLLVNAHSLHPLSYNQRETLVNPYFYVIGDPHFPLTSLKTPAANSHV